MSKEEDRQREVSAAQQREDARAEAARKAAELAKRQGKSK